ncbi:LOW QUALITY PROTEIN: SCO-spondin-like [Dendronephthya gigantea]|uniref:LOW QUALITY PROTEIN: SCO-spondin-like n=1 Tax=Dendronephthya gigantea TaxID=151771 RepID=UPI001068E950|nr:LOW QUALITY PROTEIN: SCO-spondin-like [Dendronephthya gigantea]
MWELVLQLIVFLGLITFGRTHSNVKITDKKQAAILKDSSEHHIVFPYLVDADSNFISHDIYHHHRAKRSLESPEIHYHIPFKNERFHLELKPNDGLMVSGLEVEWRSGKKSQVDRSCHFIGSVRNYPKSSVAVSNCRGLAGLIRADTGREFFIEPVLGVDPSEHDDKHAHVIYRRSVGGEKNTAEPACGVTVEDVSESPGHAHFEEEPRRKDEGGFYVKRRSKRAVSLMKHIELLLVADYSMTKYYHDRDLESYLFTIVNMLSLVFKHRSIGSAINVVLTRMIIIDTEHERGLNVTNHARKSLNDFCRWVQTINPRSDLDPKHADAAVLVTRKDICRNSYKPCETLGLSNMDGMCSRGSECSFNEDSGFSLIYTIAHELGHNLGALHDDDYSNCARLRRHIMASSLVFDPTEQLWSRCSRKAMKSFFYKGWGWCLNDQPAFDLQPKLPRRMLPGERFDADAQCKMYFGANSTICSGTETSLCRTLWCVHSSGNCATKHSYGKESGLPALDGTSCGKTKHQWCIKGECVIKTKLPESVDGGWGRWAEWSSCSQSCGKGVRRRTRKCNSPRPELGGSYCVGEWKRHSICNPQPCAEGSDNPVDIQCKKFRALSVNGKRYDWIAKQNNRNPCELRCVPLLSNGRSRIRKFIQAQDGTRCNHGTSNICIEGKCEHVGCDDKLHSSAREDRCGICRGDGSTCETRHQSFDQPHGHGYTEALVIPAQSRNIVIQEVSGSSNFLALKSPSGDYYLNGNWYIQWSGDYDVAGTSGRYSRRHNREMFRSKGPITEDLHVLLLYQGKNPGLKVQYDVKKNITTKPRYFHWKIGSWSLCSVTCGQGIQKRDMSCVDQEDNVVDKIFCENALMGYRKRRCNQEACPPAWFVGVWHECSKTCGQAVKYRAVLCTQIVVNRRQIIEEEKCGKNKPPASIMCEQPLCWSVYPWDNCSSLCGLGIQHRVVRCPGSESQCDPSTKPITNRTCVGNSCARWRKGPWEECSASCGNGTQTRQVSCEHLDENMCRQHEKPRAIQTCPGFPCPVWRKGVWSKCSVTCGNGTKTRSVTCDQGHVNFTCEASEKPVMVQSCLQEQCSGWTVGNWSSCSASCGEGVKERNVVCTIKSCTAETRPKEKERCLVGECPRWSVSEWSECTVSCGKGTQYRNITCTDPIYPCPNETKPPSVRQCPMIECSRWSLGNWSDCSVTCGSGVQTRSIICNADTQEECEVDIPKTERPCNEQPCVMWETGEWNECSASCGPGIQERSVICPSNSCKPENKPNVTRPCINPDCAVWVTGNWGDCPVSCGEGVQTRQVYCSDDDDSLCNALDMPESTRDCFVSRCGAWIITRWGPCSAKCGLGTTTRNVTCIYADARNCSNKPNVVKTCQEAPCSKWSVGKWSPCSVTCNEGFQRRIVSCHGGRCLASKKPPSIQQCVMPSCGKWVVGDWNECSASCGDGVQLRDVSCSSKDSKECTDTRPVVKRFCNKQECPYWFAGEWENCSSSCGNGIQKRNVTCIGGTSCLNTAKPIQNRPCYSGLCPKWMTGKWIPCSRSCGGGYQIRIVYCKGKTYTSCKSLTRPKPTRRCNEFPCPQWSVGSWNGCSKTCGDGGMQSRNVTCNNSEVGKCPEQSKPNIIQKCGEIPCPHWIVGRWSGCSKSCDGGSRTRDVICNNTEVGSCLDSAKPVSSENCAQEPCPHWSVGHWSECSKSCDGGIQSRNVTCENSHVGPCSDTNRPANNQTCGEVSCPHWLVGQWSKCSKSCNNGTQKRSVTCKNNHIGKCLTSAKPKSSQRCAEVACPIWSVGGWSECSQSCDGGIQSRTVTCDNNHIGNCLVATKPNSTRKCRDVPCPEWSVGPWSKCSKSCDGGEMTRTVTCQNNHVGKCKSQTRPASRATCRNESCPQWTVGLWSPCSKSCNGGSQSRSVRCNNSHVGDCPTKDKPPTSQSCGELPCPQWKFGRWGKCSKSCDGGLKSRRVWCKNTEAGECSIADKPISRKRCRKKACPSWLSGEWSQCSKTCGGGMQTRKISCKNHHIGPCDAKNKPVPSRSCSEVPCPRWSVGTWSSCSKSCGGGIQTRAVTCENGHIGECPRKKRPSTNQKCGEVPCPAWTVSAWSICSKSCGGGVQSRRVSCKNKHIGECLETEKPESDRKCSEVPCPFWSTGAWSKCSKSCGGGTKTRSITCLNNHVDECPVSDKPLTKQNCGELPCPHWTVDVWSECSKSCDGGFQTRALHCNNSHVGECPIKDRPSTNQTCGQLPCPKWIVGGWSQCTKSCGGGMKHRTVTCENRLVGNCPEAEKPLDTKSCRKVACPVWSVGKWSKCSKSCNGGTQTRVVTCKNRHVGDCLVGIKPVSRQNCSVVPCPKWTVGHWSSCSKSCDGGIRIRNVTCQNKHVGKCLPKNQPAATENCSEVPCPQWTVSPWSTCSKTCNGGIRTRIVSCQNSDVGSCSLTNKPEETKECGTEPCPKWITGVWSKCSKTCNGGLQRRNVTCQHGEVGKCRDENKPILQRSCSELPCPHWLVGPWSKCTKSCDGGLKRRTVTCVNKNVGDCLPDDKPRTMKPCHRRACPKWTTGRWSTCSKSCDGGIQTRSISCTNRHVGECLASNKPLSRRSCNNEPCPKWSVGQWSQCSQSCDGGVQKRSVICENSQVGECPLEKKPEESQSCSEMPCPEWSITEWSKCSRSCDGGIQTRNVSCVNSHVGDCVVEDKPESTRNCGDLPCPEWSITEWSKCSRSCDGGIQTRNVSCVNSHVGDCVVEDKPESTRNCGDLPCPEWSITEWSKCSRSCDGGIQTRNVSCVNSHVGDCVVEDKPESNRNCGDLPCPEWSITEWSKCSKSCDGGTQTRNVSCVNSHVGDCVVEDKPESTRSCHNVPCPEWSITEWSKCSKSCAGGTQTRNVSCVNSHVGDCVVEDKPESTRSCRNVPCPEWSIAEWSKCSKSCDGGIQTRTVKCMNSHVGECSVQKKPITRQECAKIPCPQWSVGQWSACSKSCDGGVQTRTITCVNDHVGKCLVKDEPARTRKCSEVPCPRWKVGQWSSCSKSCNGGTKTRNVSCENSSVGDCLLKNKPGETMQCGIVPCPAWSVGEWSECSKSCDGGTQSRTVSCVNNEVGDCSKEHKPVSNQNCSELPCPFWDVGSWSSCSRSCNGGTKSRTVTCRNSNVGKCNEEDEPNTHETCSDVPCPEWSVGVWSKCSRSCDGGSQVRIVTCKNNQTGKCPERERPSTNQRCNDVPCPQWIVGEWSKCSKSCGGGTQIRTVACKNEHVGTCATERRPLSSQKCGEISCPQWMVGNWSECSKSCGRGERTRSVECSGDSSLLCEGVRPAGGEVCNDLACPVWIVSDWTECKARRCPKGKQSRVVKCSWENRRACNRKTRPVARRRCVLECPKWKTGDWSKCGGSCTKGEMTRRVWCEGGNRKCKPRERPIERKSCLNSSCLVWEAGDWNQCPVTCGGGLRYRTAHCVNRVSGDLTKGCDGRKKPTRYKACALKECPSSEDYSKPPSRTQCRQAIRDAHFCRLLIRPSLSELCLFGQWKRRCCKSCFKVNAQRRR